MVITNTYQKILWEQSLRGGSERSEGELLGFKDFWNVIRPKRLKGYSRETWHAALGTLDLKMSRTKHYPDSARSWKDSMWSCAVIIDDRILFTSDTRFDPDLVCSFDDRFNFEWIFHDCQLFTGGVHASLDEICQLPEKIRKKTILMHYGDGWQAHRRQARDAGFHSWAKQGHTYTF